MALKVDPLPTSRTLLERVKNTQNQEAWETLVTIYSPLIFSFVLRQGLRGEDANEVVQEVFARLVVALPQFEYDRQKGTFRGWLLEVTRNKVCDFFRKQNRQLAGTARLQEMLNQQPACEWWDAAYAERVLHWAFEQAKPNFEPNTLESFRLIYFEQRKTAEVANTLGISPTAVAVACSKVKQRLEAIIEKEGLHL
jgi:RNA polymerase sigma-70 factor (ECF subfamily)